MNLRKLVAAGVVALMVSAGIGAATAGVGAQTNDQQQSLDERYDVSASYENGTVTLVVLANGSGVEGVDTYVDGERVGTTDTNGTVTFERTVEEELEVTIERSGFTGELEFERANGELTLVEAEFEADASDGENEGDQGPPSSIPGVTPGKVGEIHELIRQHMNGSLNGSLGEAVSEIAAGDRLDQAGDRGGKTTDKNAKNAEGPPVIDDDADEEPADENSDRDDEYAAGKEDDQEDTDI